MKFSTRLRLALRLLRDDIPTELDFTQILDEMADIEQRIAAARQNLQDAVSQAWVTAQRDNILRVPEGGDDATHPPAGH